MMEKRRKIVFIIPATGAKTDQHPYPGIAKYFENAGFEPVAVNVKWNRQPSIQECTAVAEEQVYNCMDENRDAEFYFFGFSIGAMIALALAAHYEAKGQILCSLAPYFKEDISMLPWWLRATSGFFIYPGSDRPAYPSPLEIAKVDKTILLVAEREQRYISPLIQEKRQTKIPGSESTLIIGARHKLGQEVYLQAVQKAIEKLARV